MDSDVGGDEGLLALFGLFVVVQIVVAAIAAIAMAILAVIGIVVFVSLGAGVNLLVRSLLGFLDKVHEMNERGVRTALLTVYAVPWLFLLLTFPAAQSVTALLLWLAVMVIAVPGYYWAWWRWQGLGLLLAWSTMHKWEIRLPAFDLSVPFKLDAAMQAEEQILYARVRGWQILQLFRLRVWALTTSTELKDRWASFVGEVRHGTFRR